MYMNFFIKFLSNRNLTYLRKLILHFSLKISGFKNFGNFYETGEKYFIQIRYRNCLQ